ncbi:hypothetical protein ABZS96_25970 [Streptomyces avermitilis]|uniref:hypothetical protein n=1 Tax=Streptomyces avermitilis TaxID=33903 RepID=UPI0033AC1EED
MSTFPQPPTGPGGEFRPDYTPQPWYHENQPTQGSIAADFPPPAPPIGCRVCGAHPVAPVTVRAHQGLLLAMRWQRIDGPLCSLCGIALVRQLTTKTLWQGWWGPMSLVAGAPYALLSNLAAYRQIRRLEPPLPAPGRPQANPGKPVLKRPLAYVALIPLCWAIWVLTHMIT